MSRGPAALVAIALAGLLGTGAAAIGAAPIPIGAPSAAPAVTIIDGTGSLTAVDPKTIPVTVAPIQPGPQPKVAPASAVMEMSHVWQSLNNCGPAAVVMALSTLGVDVSQETARLPLRGANIQSGMGPQRVDPWVSEQFGLRSIWRNNGTNELMRRLVANGFAPMVTQWMQDPWISRIAHWRTIRGYDDALGTFYVNDSMLGRMVPLSYQWFQNNWQPFSYRYMVIYEPTDEALLRAIIGDDWSDLKMRANFYERMKVEAKAHDTSAAWLAYGQAAYGYGAFAEAVEAFERGIAMGSVQGVFTIRSSYPQALRALGRQTEADAAAQKLSTTTSSSTVAAPPDPFALYLAFMRRLPANGPTLFD
jgi:peptidase C39-like protein